MVYINTVDTGNAVDVWMDIYIYIYMHVRINRVFILHNDVQMNEWMDRLMNREMIDGKK